MRRLLVRCPSLLFFSAIACLFLATAACDHGLTPPDAPPVGTIRGTITYVDPDHWPSADSLNDLRFFALPFIPEDTLDLFRDLNQLVFSNTLRRDPVQTDTFSVQNVVAQVYVYSGVAQQYSPALLDWRPLGLYEDNGGFLIVRPGEVTEVAITVDFRRPPPFPPSSSGL